MCGDELGGRGGSEDQTGCKNGARGKGTTDCYPTQLQPFTVTVSLFSLLHLILPPSVASANPAALCNYLKTFSAREAFTCTPPYADQVSLYMSEHDELFRNFRVRNATRFCHGNSPALGVLMPRNPRELCKMGAIII